MHACMISGIGLNLSIFEWERKLGIELGQGLEPGLGLIEVLVRLGSLGAQ